MTELVAWKITYSRRMEQMPLFKGKNAYFYGKWQLWRLVLSMFVQYGTRTNIMLPVLLRTELVLPRKDCVATNIDKRLAFCIVPLLFGSVKLSLDFSSGQGRIHELGCPGCSPPCLIYVFKLIVFSFKLLLIYSFSSKASLFSPPSIPILDPSPDQD